MSLVDYLSLSIKTMDPTTEPDAVYKVKGNRDSNTQCVLLYAWLGDNLVAYYFSHEVEFDMSDESRFGKPKNIFVIPRKDFEEHLKEHHWEKLN